MSVIAQREQKERQNLKLQDAIQTLSQKSPIVFAPMQPLNHTMMITGGSMPLANKQPGLTSQKHLIKADSQRQSNQDLKAIDPKLTVMTPRKTHPEQQQNETLTQTFERFKNSSPNRFELHETDLRKWNDINSLPLWQVLAQNQKEITLSQLEAVKHVGLPAGKVAIPIESVRRNTAREQTSDSQRVTGERNSNRDYDVESVVTRGSNNLPSML